jgi:hypothetical protein
MAVIERTKQFANPEKNAGVIMGRVIFLNVSELSAPKSMEASSMEGSICSMAAIPFLIPTGRFLNTSRTMIMNPVPVKAVGINRDGVLKARIYPIPTTVPGTAKVSILENSIAFFPKNCFLLIR